MQSIFEVIKRNIVNEQIHLGQNCWSYKFPRNSGVTTFLKYFAMEKAVDKENVLFLTYNTNSARELRKYFNTKEFKNSYIEVSTFSTYMLNVDKYTDLDWLICDNIMYSPIHYEKFKNEARAKNILCIDTV